MRISVMILIFVLLTIKAQEVTSDVQILNDANFLDFVSKHQFVFVKFYAPWCTHCQKMAPEWEKFATMIKTSPPLGLQGLDIQIAEIDAAKNTQAKAQYQVQGFPTLLLFKNAKSYQKYQGKRSANDFMNYLLQELVKTEL